LAPLVVVDVVVAAAAAAVVVITDDEGAVGGDLRARWSDARPRARS